MRKIGCLGYIGLLLCSMIIVFGMLFFNAWYLQCIYEFGIVPVLTQFSVFLPDLGYWVFMLMWVCISSIVLMFKTKTDDDSKIDIEDTNSLGKAFAKILGVMLTKCLQIIILFVVHMICFS